MINSRSSRVPAVALAHCRCGPPDRYVEARIEHSSRGILLSGRLYSGRRATADHRFAQYHVGEIALAPRRLSPPRRALAGEGKRAPVTAPWRGEGQPAVRALGLAGAPRLVDQRARWG